MRLLGNKTLTKKEKPGNHQTIHTAKAMALQVLAQVASDPQATGKSADEVGKYMKDQMKEAIDYFKPQAEKGYNLDFDPRKEIVGDNYDDYSGESYGNNHYEGPDAKHGTHVAGIIAGLANGKEPQYGVASRGCKDHDCKSCSRW